MAVQTRNITVTIFDNDGTPLEGARVEIKLIGLGNEPGGAVSPGLQADLTDANGIASFVLWENRLDYSDTYYEISSWHPTEGTAIHRREPFIVGDSDADVKDLINVAPVQIDPNAALLAQINADKALIANSVTTAANSATSASASATSAASSATTATSSASSSASAATQSATYRDEAEAARDEAVAAANNAGASAIEFNIYDYTVESA